MATIANTHTIPPNSLWAIWYSHFGWAFLTRVEAQIFLYLIYFIFSIPFAAWRWLGSINKVAVKNETFFSVSFNICLVCSFAVSAQVSRFEEVYLYAKHRKSGTEEKLVYSFALAQTQWVFGRSDCGRVRPLMAAMFTRNSSIFQSSLGDWTTYTQQHRNKLST